ncbi:MAG TPA: 16S rRNA (cytidine(1402)-2'-O)-methyltransferase [Dehalococcoidia bacterium]|jgi:16S rRNA (cytidine1402-2'-O)-methyltransferase|nr:16S rRNA (cytidine(1402)-2'-O)-methyltransferase [Dehalococcoidia bacterium]HIK89013.1 16S rRNA (cytidine(1402)-2'-O)-methyltransferase [Dehalococcoidia bacterium]
MSTLYVVATPIGNLSDLTKRAIEVLSTIPVVAAEDTRVTRKLLNHLGVSPQLESLHEHTTPERLNSLISKLANSDIALVTDAGTPGISDPGSSLVAAAVEAGHDVIPLPGPSAIVTALSITGWAFDRFLFLGFLPRKKKDRLEAITGILNEPGPIVIYESPHRIKATLIDIAQTLPDRQLVICRELTKLYEETFRGTAKQAIDHFSEPRGEFVIVIEGGNELPPKEISDEQIKSELEKLQSEGIKGRTLVDQVVELTGAPKNRVYTLSLAKD